MAQFNGNSHSLIIDYYEGAYGPTIRIDTVQVSDLVLLRSVFLALAEGQPTCTDLGEALGARISGSSGITLEVVLSDPKRCLKRAKSRTRQPEFRWLRSAKGWRWCAAMVDGLLKKQTPGHQYLTNEKQDEALIELAFKERAK